MKLCRFVAASAALLTFSFGLVAFLAQAADFEGTSHKDPVVMTQPENNSSIVPPSSSKPPSSAKESSSKQPSSSTATSSRRTSSKKPSSSSSKESSSDSRSNNNFLKSLRVVDRAKQSVAFSLTPAFNKNTLSYSVAVPSDVSGVALFGKAEDSAAKVEYNNINTLTDGKVNRLSVTCVAQDGQKRVYTINVVRGTVTSSDMMSSDQSSEDSSLGSSSGGAVSLPPVVVGELSSGDALLSVPAKSQNGNLWLGILAWVLLLGGLAMVVLVILNGSPAKKSIGSSAVGTYTPSHRQSRTKRPRKKARKRLLGDSYYSKYSRYKH